MIVRHNNITFSFAGLFDRQKRQEKKRLKQIKKQEKYYIASQWQLIYRKLVKHKLAVASTVVIGILYLGAIFAGFISPQGLEEYSGAYSNAPPTRIHFFHNGKWEGPYVYCYNTEYNDSFKKVFVEDKSRPYRIKLFVKGSSYKLLGLFKSDIHLYGADNTNLPEGKGKVIVALFGTDTLGRDLFSRILIGSQISLTVPLVGTAIAFFIGLVIGSVSGYYGGIVDNIIQRAIEVITSFPSLPLWMALSAAIPPDIPVAKVFLYITIIMAVLYGPGMGRGVRSKYLSLKNDDYVTAAKLAGVGDIKIMFKHLLPGYMSVLIVGVTLAIPGMILGETTMSFLGLGMRAPATSWGVLLQECQKVANIADCPWKLIPLIFVAITIFTFNFLGDGLRDAADPYK